MDTARAKQRGIEREIKDGQLECLDCGPQPVAEFYVHRDRQTGRSSFDSRCHKCRRLRLVAQKHSISAKEYQTVLDSAGGSCAICGSAGKLVLDHCHRTGRLRGAICALCNTGLAAVENNPRFAAQALEYLRLWNQTPMTDAECARAKLRQQKWEHVKETERSRGSRNAANQPKRRVLRSHGRA